MPRWGRPPGAQLGGLTRRQEVEWMGNNTTVEEIDSGEEDEYVVLRDKQLAASTGRRRQNIDYDKFANEVQPIDGVDYDLYDDSDSTVAYAVRLAMKDKEEWLVDKALERIRRAQLLGQKNIRLSNREIEALERKRLQTGSQKGFGQYEGDPFVTPVDDKRPRLMDSSPNGVTARTGIPRSLPGISQGSTIAPDPFLSDKNDIHNSWARTSSSSLGVRTPPRTPTKAPRSLGSSPSSKYPLQQNYASEPSYLSVPNGRLQAPFQSRSILRPLPPDPQWTPSYKVSRSMESSPYSLNATTDLRGSPRRSYQSYRSVLDAHASITRRPLHAPSTPKGSSGDSSSEIEDEFDQDSNQVHMVDVVQRKVPRSPTTSISSRASLRTYRP